MGDRLIVPAQIAQGVLTVAEQLNPNYRGQLGVVVIVVANESAPEMISNLAPEAVMDLLRFMIENSTKASTVVHVLNDDGTENQVN